MCYLQIIIYYLFSLFEVLYLLISAFYGGRFIILFAFVLVLVFTKFLLDLMRMKPSAGAPSKQR